MPDQSMTDVDRQRVSQLTQPATFRVGQQSPYLRIFEADVFVRDLDRSVEFYVDRLGFSVVADGRFEFSRWVAIAPPEICPGYYFGTAS